MRSMTGFGEASGSSERYRVRVRVRTVNHRHLHLVLRCDEELRQSEEAVRTLVGERLGRGRVELALDIRSTEPPPLRLVLNEELARALRQAAGRLTESDATLGEPSFGDFLRLPGAYELVPEEREWRPEDEALLLHAVGRALDGVVETRVREGEALAAALRGRLERLSEMKRGLEQRRESVRAELAARLKDRLEELLGGVPVDSERLAQEAAVLVDRSDVAEELDRLEAHFEHFEELLEAEEAVGRRLDFLAQEMGRELATVGAKCRDSEMGRTSLEMRNLVEQLREQIQNVE